MYFGQPPRNPFFSAPPVIRRSVFMSYHHGGDQWHYNEFTRLFHDDYEAIWDNSLERRIDSESVNYVIQRIRDKFITGTSCTIVLCGANTWKRKYVDWEIKASLDKQHGLIGVQLPTLRPVWDNKVQIPDRLHDNIQSGFAIWAPWGHLTASIESLKAHIEEAVAKPKRLIDNRRPMMSYNKS